MVEILVLYKTGDEIETKHVRHMEGKLQVDPNTLGTGHSEYAENKYIGRE
jgi:hypothetical protein